MKWGDGVGIVTLCLAILAIALLTKQEKGHQDRLLWKVENAEQTKMMMAR